MSKLKEMLDKVVTGTATQLWKVDRKAREFYTCPNRKETGEFLEAYLEPIAHIANCHVCRGLMVKALNARKVPKPKELTAGQQATQPR